MKKREFVADGHQCAINQLIPVSTGNVKGLVHLTLDGFIELKLKIIKQLNHRAYVEWPWNGYHDGGTKKSYPPVSLPEHIADRINSFILNECENQRII